MPPVEVHYSGRSEPVRFLGRPNRYLARVRRLDTGQELEVHVPNPGRMEELLVPGETLGWIVGARGAQRRTSFDLVAVRAGRTTVSIDSRIANRLTAHALRSRSWRPRSRGRWVAEYAWQDCRFDFAVPGGTGPVALLEVKSSNLRVGRTALFPDSPTVRGTHHLDVLAKAARRGVQAVVLFVVQRNDVEEFSPNRRLDPRFARSFDRALDAGVELLAREMIVRPGVVRWGRALPVRSRPTD